MKTFRTIRSISAATLAAGLVLSTCTLALAESPVHLSGLQSGQEASHAPIRPESAADKTAGPVTWTTDQLLTSTVHEAWVMSGRNEATFFKMVTELAVLSAQKRDLKLPETEKAGQEFGSMIKKMAKSDTDALLYEVVDKAVRKVGVPIPASGS